VSRIVGPISTGGAQGIAEQDSVPKLQPDPSHVAEVDKLRMSELQPFLDRLNDMSRINWSHVWSWAAGILIGALLGGWFGYIQIDAPTANQTDTLTRACIGVSVLVVIFIAAAVTTRKERADSAAAIKRDLNKLLAAWQPKE
jgi:hypothetical protein